jgi:hypothetical protein
MILSVVLSFAILIPLSMQLRLEESRREVTQLDRANVAFYPKSEWGEIAELAGLEVIADPEVSETEFGTTVIYEVINVGRLEGRREVWAKLYSPTGHLREGMKIWLELTPKGRNRLEFFFTGSAAEFRESSIELGF